MCIFLFFPDLFACVMYVQSDQTQYYNQLACLREKNIHYNFYDFMTRLVSAMVYLISSFSQDKNKYFFSPCPCDIIFFQLAELSGYNLFF